MSTTTTLFGAAEAQAARTLIGGTAIGDNRNDLLKQLLVATANRTGGSSSVAFADITGSPGDNAALAAALASAGGSTIDLTLQAWVDTSTGDDLTGEIGSPATPYETIQAAYDDGARVFHVSGAVGPLELADESQQVTLLGVGRDRSIVGAITLTADPTRNVLICGNGASLVKVTSITTAAPNGAQGTSAPAGCALHVMGLHLTGNFTRVGGLGAAGVNGGADEPGGSGGDGGHAGITSLNDVVYDSNITFAGGNGGDGGDGGSSTDPEGFGPGGGNGGTAGGGGYLQMTNVVCTNESATITMSEGSPGGEGDGGYGPAGNGANGSPGSGSVGGDLTLRHCTLPGVSISLAGLTQGNLISQFSIYAEVTDYSPGGEVANIIAGVWTP